MNFRNTLFFLFFISICAGVYGQNTGNNRFNNLITKTDTIQIDTLSLIPGSVRFYLPNGDLLDTAYYKINYADGKLVLNRKKIKQDNISIDSLKSSYKTFPYLFSQETKHKDVSRIKPDLMGITNPFSYDISSKNDDIFKMDGLNKSGSISRGITFGNNQDMVVNSNLDLQLSGHLSNNVDILLAATDNNIPVQPEGNTQQLQEFDKVFIQLSNANSKLIAGDFQLVKPTGYFMNFNKKAQGASFSTALKTNKDSKDKTKQGIYKTTLSAAVSRGKFARNLIQGIENNQGPYRLHGAENEPYIIILSGTEKVFIDGRLVERGQENDYTINYNNAEISFTAKQLITKDKRIVVEFQYSDKNYSRSLVHLANDYEQNKLKVHLHVYSEQDNKNQPLQQDLSDEQKKLLSRIGDTLSSAVIPSFDSVPFTNKEVLYKRIDTTVGSYPFNSIFVYNTDSTNIKKYFRVSFSNVGAGKGNYIQINSSANGKVFQWITPDTANNIIKPRGNFEPVIQLITPKKKQMVTAGFDYTFNRNSKLNVEAAVTNNDINTFSSTDSDDDIGYGLKMNYDNAKPLKKELTNDTIPKGLVLNTNVNYEYVQKNFSPIERYRSTEFERDWNRGNALQADDQHIIGAGVGLSKKDLGRVGYKFNTFLEGEEYNGNKHFVSLNLRKKKFAVLYDGSLLNTKSNTTSVTTNFYRHKSGISQGVKNITIGLKDEFEQNKFSLIGNTILSPTSYRFWEWQAYLKNADSALTHYGVGYKQRTDDGIRPTGSDKSLKRSSHSSEYNGFLEFKKNPNSQLKLNASYRILDIDDTLISIQKPDNSLVARVEYNFKLWKGFVSSGSFYEIGSGLETKKEFYYIEVAPGLGIYLWNDYNQNNIKELNEFEVAPVPSLGTYIKVYTPTTQYFKTYNNQFSEIFTLRPAALWENKTGIKKFISNFSDMIAYRVDRKSIDDNLIDAYNPFLGTIYNNNLKDSVLISLNSSFRNTLYVNQMNPVYGFDISYQDNKNKLLLVNGFDTRRNRYEELHFRWNIIQQLLWNLDSKEGRKESRSQYFSSRDYYIQYYELEPKLSYQPNTAFRLSVSFKYSNKGNSSNIDSLNVKAILEDFGTEIKWNVLNKGSFNLKANYIQISYDASQQNTSLAFEMLDALKPGQNFTWGLSYQRTLSNNIQISITYDGRKSANNPAIHTGGAQVRAFF